MPFSSVEILEEFVEAGRVVPGCSKHDDLSLVRRDARTREEQREARRRWLAIPANRWLHARQEEARRRARGIPPARKGVPRMPERTRAEILAAVDARLDEIKARRAAGMTFAAIARELGVSRRLVGCYARKLRDGGWDG